MRAPADLRRVIADLRIAATMPRVDVVLSRGGAHEERLLHAFRQRHPRLKVVGRKVVGVALLPLEEFADVDGYLEQLRSTRKRVLRARRLGYRVATFDPDERRADILAIHTSLPERQGRPIDPEYLDEDAVYEHGPHIDYVGVFRDDVVVAYSRVEYAGDIAGMGRLMGHGDHLDDGVMFLLTAGIVTHVKEARPHTRFLFYDTFLGAPEGLRAFKTRLGFRPYYVRWRRARAPVPDPPPR